MKKTYKELITINGVVGNLYNSDPELEKTKFGYAWKKFVEKNIDPINKKMAEKMADIAVEHALEDETTKALLTDEKGNYQYSKAGKIALMKAEREYNEKLNNEEYEIEPYISRYYPKSMTEEQDEILNGVLITTLLESATSPVDSTLNKKGSK